MGSIPGLGRTPGEGNGNPLQHSGLGIAMDKGTWWVTVHDVSKRLQLSRRVCIQAHTHTHTHTHIHTYTQHGYNRGSRRAFLENKFKSNACGVRMCVDFVEEKMNLTAIHKFAKSNGDGNEH